MLDRFGVRARPCDGESAIYDRSIRIRPKVDQSNRLDTLGADLVELANPIWFFLQVTVELLKTHPPMLHVGVKLADFLLKVLEQELIVVFLTFLQFRHHALTLFLKCLAKRCGFSFAALGKAFHCDAGELLRTGYELGPEFFDVARGAVQKASLNDLVRRITPTGQRLIENPERERFGLAGVRLKWPVSATWVGPPRRDRYDLLVESFLALTVER